MLRSIAVPTPSLRLLMVVCLGVALPVQAVEPPPPPPELKELIERGGVTFDFYDPQQKKMSRPGLTQFVLTCNWEYRLSAESRTRAGKTRVVVKPFGIQVTSRVEQTMLLPREMVDDAFWKKSLVLHEFDHVTVVADPRPRRLMQHMADKLRVVERTLERGQQPSDALHKEMINDELNARRQAITDLINRNHVLLDAQSQHGAVALPQRLKFFQDLYTKSNLTAAEFPYLSEVLDLLPTKAYSQPEPLRAKK